MIIRETESSREKIIPVMVAAAVATVLFGVYHFAHSAPFNQPSKVLLLMYPAILTSMSIS